MIPGYGDRQGVPYFSPILVHKVTSWKSKQKILTLEFFNAGYAQGVQNFKLDMHVLHTGPTYVVSRLDYRSPDAPDRCAVVSEIGFDWIGSFCPWVMSDTYDPDAQPDVQEYLNSAFRLT
ncbi:MAG TPA: hypothetical protein VNN55_03705 [bacterium]|nr:hypothetical protein [bacterium]